MDVFDCPKSVQQKDMQRHMKLPSRKAEGLCSSACLCRPHLPICSYPITLKSVGDMPTYLRNCL